EATRSNETALRHKISALDNRIGRLEIQVGDVSQTLTMLEQDLALRQRRLADLTQLYRLQTSRLNDLKLQYKRSVGILNRRLVAIYESETPSTIDFVLGATSIDDMLEKVNDLNLIGKEDRQIAIEVKQSKLMLQSERVNTRKLRL